MIKYILFDLDDTLYPKEIGLMAAIGQRIHQYMQERVGLDPVGARDLRRHYLQTYGTTLKGLQVHYNVGPWSSFRPVSLADRDKCSLIG